MQQPILVWSELALGSFRQLNPDDRSRLRKSGQIRSNKALAIVDSEILDDGSQRCISVSHDEIYRSRWQKLFWKLAANRSAFVVYYDYAPSIRRSMMACRASGEIEDWPWPDPRESHSRSLAVMATNSSSKLFYLLDEANQRGWPDESEFDRMMERNRERDFEIIPDDAFLYVGVYGEERSNTWLLLSRDPIERFHCLCGHAFPDLPRFEVASKFFVDLDNDLIRSHASSSRPLPLTKLISHWRVRKDRSRLSDPRSRVANDHIASPTCAGHYRFVKPRTSGQVKA